MHRQSGSNHSHLKKFPSQQSKHARQNIPSSCTSKMMINIFLYIKNDVLFPISDDIEESYKHLRRLVMDYLGISIPSFESEAGDVMETKDTENAPTGTQLGTRTWSRPSIPDSMSQQYTRGKTTQSPSLSGRGILVSQENHSILKALLEGQSFGGGVYQLLFLGRNMISGEIINYFILTFNFQLIQYNSVL